MILDGVQLDVTNTLRTRLLLAAKVHRDVLLQLQNSLLIKAVLLDRTDAQAVSEFNQAAKAALEHQFPEQKRKMKTPQDANAVMKDFSAHLTKLKDKAKLKNFEKAQ